MRTFPNQYDELTRALNLSFLSTFYRNQVESFGFKEDKEKKATKKEAAISESIANPANAELIAKFQELLSLLGKEGNAHACATYAKVIKALKGIEYEITADNALSLAKGKTKVPNIGKGTAEKVHEFFTTGKIQKLEDKRAEMAM